MTLAERLVRGLDQVKGIDDLSCAREHRVEHSLDTSPTCPASPSRCPPARPVVGQPHRRCCGVAVFEDMEELTSTYVHDLGRPTLSPVAATAAHEDLVQPDSISRDSAIHGASSVHVFIKHPSLGQRQRILCHTSRTARPQHGRSTSSTRSRSLTCAFAPQPGHGGRPRHVSTCTRSGTYGSQSSTRSTATRSSPTKRRHINIGLVVTGAQLSWLRQPLTLGALDPRPALTSPPHPADFRRAR